MGSRAAGKGVKDVGLRRVQRGAVTRSGGAGGAGLTESLDEDLIHRKHVAVRIRGELGTSRTRFSSRTADCGSEGIVGEAEFRALKERVPVGCAHVSH